MSKSLIIDPGHGGKDPGANGFGQKEKDLTLRMSLYQYRRFKELGAKVSLTRTTDTTLDSGPRTAMIKSKYDFCLSNHFNAAAGKGSGVETIKSIHTKSKIAHELADAVVKASGLPLRRVFDREHPSLANTDYYYMHRQTGSTNTVIVEYGFIDREKDNKAYRDDKTFFAAAEAVVKVYCKHLGVTYKAPGGSSTSKPAAPENKPVPAPEPDKGTSTKGLRLESTHEGELRFYNKPSWDDKDVYGTMKKGQGFPEVLGKVKVGDAYQYKVKNGKGEVYYTTAASQFVKLIGSAERPAASKPAPAKPSKPAATYKGKRVESKHGGKLRFYNKPSWDDKDVVGTVTKGYGFPRVLDRVNVGGAQQYKVQNSRGQIFYITASDKFVKLV